MNMTSSTTTNTELVVQAEFASPSTALVTMIQKNTQDIPTDLDEEATLNLIYYKYLHLYDAWMKERQDTQVQVAQLKDLVKIFDAQVKAFASFEDKIRQNLLDMVRRSVTGGILEVSERILDDTTEGAKKVTHELRTEVNHAKHELEHYKSYLNRQHAKTIAVAAIIVTVVALGVIKYFMPPPLTEAAAHDIEVGRTIDNLSASQQVRIQKIINENQANTR